MLFQGTSNDSDELMGMNTKDTGYPELLSCIEPRDEGLDKDVYMARYGWTWDIGIQAYVSMIWKTGHR